MTGVRTPDTFARNLETNVREILKDKNATTAERLKAIDAGIKIAALRARLRMKPGEKGDDDSFFS